MSTRIILTLVLILGITVTAIRAQDVSPQQPIGPYAEERQGRDAQPPSPRYRLGQGDVIELNFPFTPEFNQTVTVNPDGFVTLQVAGDVKVVGLTTEELRTSLEPECRRSFLYSSNPRFRAM